VSTAPAELDEQIRIAERAVYEHSGAHPTEKVVALETTLGAVEVRVNLFGPDSDSRPPILLLHGIASISVFAAPLLAYLDGRRVIAVDWPGHGLSGPSILPAGTNLRKFVVSLVGALMDGFDLDVVDLIGHSLGGQFALYAALDLGPRVRRIVLLGAPGAAFEGVKPVPVMIILATPVVGRRMLALPVSRKAFVRNNERMLGAGALQHVPEELVTAGILIGKRKAFAPSVASYFRALIRRRMVRTDVMVEPRELATLTQPTLIAIGDEDVFLNAARAASSINAIPNRRVLQLPAVGHAPWLQAPDAVGTAIAEHLG
jgi:pimeloyl-ACP methyl ester carboxylesterase